jgi:hypothetical protein
VSSAINSSERLKFFGVRHHGPGCAASLRCALNAFDPLEVLIEGPPEANDIIALAVRPGMRPPVALLVYGANDAALATFFPFAEYSPEWIAIQWALTRNRKVRFIDLPVSARWAQQASAQDEPASDAKPVEPPHDEHQHQLALDPLRALAEIDGHSDSETWWTQLVEQATGGEEVFDAIAEAMAAVRTSWQSENTSSPMEQRREAYMRTEIAKSLEASDSKIAVVCGAWHVPALACAVTKIDTKADKELLKGITKTKTLATWIAWTDSRLASQSGYGAGVDSPGWYRHLWNNHLSTGVTAHPVEMASRWQSRVASLLRDEGLPASSASVIEAARLAVSLASVRGLSLPGLAEMQDASLSVVCHGDSMLMRVIERKLVIGDRLGEVDESIPQTPLAEDLARWQKKLRLTVSESDELLSLDLRTENGLMRSELLHRLRLIQVPWGREKHAGSSRGSFRENWVIAWDPQFTIALAEAVRYGTTIESAAKSKVLAEIANVELPMSMARCAELIGMCLKANLVEAVDALTTHMQALSVTAQDMKGLIDAVPPLIQVLRYGTARKMPKEALQSLVNAMVAEICVGLAYAARGLTEESVQLLFASVRQLDSAIPLMESVDHTEQWFEALQRMERDDLVVPPLRGFALRKLYDECRIALEVVTARLQFSLSISQPPLVAGQWLEGFLTGTAQLLIHDPHLFSVIDRWLVSIVESEFIELLPMFRRAVTSFDYAERRQIFERAKSYQSEEVCSQQTTLTASALSPGFVQALPLLKTILGIES